MATPRSFCAGVERAIEIVERAIQRFGLPVYVRKQIVHNSHVVTALEERGAIFVDELSDVPPRATVVFSAHGVSPDVRGEAESRDLHVIDATCPLVTKVHAEARRFAAAGRTVVLIGHVGHDEVEGTIGEAPEAIRVVATAEDVSRLEVDPDSRVAYISQTTLAVDETSSIVDALRRRFPDIEAPDSNDICYASQNRQDVAREVASQCDVMLVVGSRNSSNCLRLTEVAQREGCAAYLIDDEREIDHAWIKGVRTIGVTAGASAPEEIVQRVVARLRTLGAGSVEFWGVEEQSPQFTLPRELR